jgi:hypothetical protein
MNSCAATFAENNVHFSVFSLSFRTVGPEKLAFSSVAEDFLHFWRVGQN